MSKKLRISFAAILILFGINKAAFSLSTNLKSDKSSQITASDTLRNTQDTITALDITRNKYQNKLIRLETSQYSDSSKKESVLEKEYSVFIDYLGFQIIHYCEELHKNYGAEAIKKLPCYVSNTERIDSEVETAEEKIESLDNQFMAALGEFDEMLLNEDEKIAQIEQNESSSESNNSHSKQGGMAEYSGAKAKNSEKKNTTGRQSEKNNNKQKENKNSKGRRKQSSNKNYQRKKLDEIDDDIVSRQLKEAAEKETNPELKEKLWDEYYKYKKTIGK